jgi:hypothetical protein
VPLAASATALTAELFIKALKCHCFC